MEIRVLTVLALSALLLSGCDAIRGLAGRPTSKDIDSKRSEIAAYEQSLDSLAQQAAPFVEDDEDVRSVSEIGGLDSEPLDSRYYVIVGAFKIPANADSMMKTVSSKGYDPIRIVFSNGFIAVGLMPTNSLFAAKKSLDSILMEDFCPLDVWILCNN